MRVLVAVDGFKGSLTSAEAGAAVAAGLAEGFGGLGIEAWFDVVPVADGGEGTVESMRAAAGGDPVTVSCRGPLGDPVEAAFLALPGGKDIVLETAASCGLTLVRDRRDIFASDTAGLGDQIRAALDRRPERILIGIGGSATNDGGAGAARVLGARFLDVEGREIGTTPAELQRLRRADFSGLDPRLGGVRFEVLCDVDNPLLGPAGASRVYAPQKGADPGAVARLEAILAGYADAVEAAVRARLRDLPGAGAAGGLGFGLAAILGARLRPGIDVLIDAARLRERARHADLVITGEGRLDAQSLHGKTPAGIAALAAEAGAPCAAFCGRLGAPVSDFVPARFAAVYEIRPLAGSDHAAMTRAEHFLSFLARSAAAQLAELTESTC